MKKLVVGALLLAGCASGPVDTGAHVAARDTRPAVVEFQGTANAATGELSFSSGGHLAQGLSQVTVVQDGNPGAGPANTAELVSTFAGAGNGACGVPESLCWSVTAESFYGDPLPNAFVEIDSMTPDTGFRGLNSVASQMGLDNTYGLWSYGTLPSNAPSDSQLWTLGDGGGSGTFTFHGRLMADVPVAACSVLVISDGQSANNAELVADLQAQGITVTLVEGVASYTGVPDASGFGAVLLAVGNDYGVEMPQAGQDSIVAAHAAGKGFVSTAWFSYSVTSSGVLASLANFALYAYESGNEGSNALDFTLTSPGHPIWNGLPGTFTFSGSSGWNIANTLTNGGTTIATSTAAGIGVAVRDDAPAGRVVTLANSGNYNSTNQWTAGPELGRMAANSVLWSCQ